jgi:hypothetical protein
MFHQFLILIYATLLFVISNCFSLNFILFNFFHVCLHLLESLVIYNCHQIILGTSSLGARSTNGNINVFRFLERTP